MTDIRQVFQEYAERNAWGDSESLSGPGSTLLATTNLRAQLPILCETFSINTFFDAPCGDFNWMQQVLFPAGLTYIGGDIVPELVKRNRADHALPDRRFIEFDITSSEFPDADLWFCRDCFFHLPFEMVLKALKNFYESGIPWLMTSNHVNASNFENHDIPVGGFKLMDLFKEPYFFPRDPKFTIADYIHPYPAREMALWSRGQVLLGIKRMEASLWWL